MLYLERNKELREKFIKELDRFDRSLLVYIDESGVDKDFYRPYGRSKRGKKIYGERSGKYKKRVSMISGLCEDKFQAPMYFQGYTNTEIFNVWLKEFLVPTLRPGQVVIIDNASFHKSKKTQEIIEEAGDTILYLPAYFSGSQPNRTMVGYI